jgi:hypothetical protein
MLMMRNVVTMTSLMTNRLSCLVDIFLKAQKGYHAKKPNEKMPKMAGTIKLFTTVIVAVTCGLQISDLGGSEW